MTLEKIRAALPTTYHSKKRGKKMKIIQLILGPSTQTWQDRMVGLGDDGKVYVEIDKRDSKGRLTGKIWQEVEIDPPKSSKRGAR